MDLAPEIQEAIRSTVNDAEQPEVVANRLIAWFNSLSVGNETLADRDAVSRHMELLLESIVVDVVDENE